MLGIFPAPRTRPASPLLLQEWAAQAHVQGFSPRLEQGAAVPALGRAVPAVPLRPRQPPGSSSSLPLEAGMVLEELGLPWEACGVTTIMECLFPTIRVVEAPLCKPRAWPLLQGIC